MEMTVRWQSELKFEALTDEHSIQMDTKPPLGRNSAPSPKQLLLASLCGCTSMDVVSLLKKYKQDVDSFIIEAAADVTETQEYPVVFREVNLTFCFEGQLEVSKVLEAVKLSQTKYCGISAMLSKAFPIKYSIKINGNIVESSEAKF